MVQVIDQDAEVEVGSLVGELGHAAANSTSRHSWNVSSWAVTIAVITPILAGWSEARFVGPGIGPPMAHERRNPHDSAGSEAPLPGFEPGFPD